MELPLALIYFVLYTLIFALGCALGSFVNVVVYRMSVEIPVIRGRSFCPNCGKKIAFYDNIPLISYLWLGGKCRKCGEKISLRYFFTELAGGLLALLMFWHYGADKSAALALVIAIILLAVTLLDIDTLKIPNRLVIALAVAGLLSFWVFLGPDLKTRIIGVFVVSVPMLLATFIRRDCFGGGDIKLMAAAGFLLGWPGTLLAAFVAVLTGGAAALLYQLKKERPQKMAFGPWLCLGILIAMLWGEQILHWYLSFIGL
ncbi:MAG: prepilin peptidase [Eubacterium sp.]|nr:prepilin peptidase [Eubacterium sp.]